MSPTLYIIGTSHSLQCGADTVASEKIRAYEAELSRQVTTLNIQRIAEEMSEDGLKRHLVTETVAQRLAVCLGKTCHHVDLSREESAALSIADGDKAIADLSLNRNDKTDNFLGKFDALIDDVRERIWVAKILAKSEWPVLFICGANHSIAIQKLWCELGLKVEILHEDFEPMKTGE